MARLFARQANDYKTILSDFVQWVAVGRDSLRLLNPTKNSNEHSRVQGDLFRIRKVTKQHDTGIYQSIQQIPVLIRYKDFQRTTIVLVEFQVQ